LEQYERTKRIDFSGFNRINVCKFKLHNVLLFNGFAAKWVFKHQMSKCHAMPSRKMAIDNRRWYGTAAREMKVVRERDKKLRSLSPKKIRALGDSDASTSPSSSPTSSSLGTADGVTG
jgi:hypothetical protein